MAAHKTRPITELRGKKKKKRCKRNVQSTQEENYRTKKHGNTKGF